jgi:starch synthase
MIILAAIPGNKQAGKNVFVLLRRLILLYIGGMRVLFVTSECVPFFKKGGLGDVSYALPVALSKLDVDCSIVLPYYTEITNIETQSVGKLAVDYDGKRELVTVYKTTLPGSNVSVYLLRHNFLNDYYGTDIADTFCFFSAAVVKLYLYAPEILGGVFDVVHCHDWHAALVPLMLGENDKGSGEAPSLEAKVVKTILTIHNLLYRGEAKAEVIGKLGLPGEIFHIFKNKEGKYCVWLLREGLEYADMITTVSPTYAAEIMSGTQGGDIPAVLRRRQDRVQGILNGIDPTIWDPKIDPSLPVNYSENLNSVFSGKAEVKKALRSALHLPEVDVPLFGFVGRLEAAQKGLDILYDAVKSLPQNTYQLAILGTGSDKVVAMLTMLAEDCHNIAFTHTFDERLARRIYAGSDLMLVPSKFEPCGLTQMIAMRYGTIPLVRKTGGLADSVKEDETGFVFEEYSAHALADKMKKAIQIWAFDKDKWRKMIETAMQVDYSWDESAKKYLAMYEKLINNL